MSATISRLYPEWVPLFISSLSSRFGTFVNCNLIQTPVLNSNTNTANLATYTPFSIPFNYPVNRFFWINQVTLSGTVDVGIYTASGTKLISTGAVAQAGASAVQYATPITPLLLPPGSYYLGFSTSSGTATFLSTSQITAALWARLPYGVLQQTTAHPLPASMTPATPSVNFLPLCGFTRTTSGF